MSTTAVTKPLGQITQGDTAELTAYLRVNEQPVTQDQILGVNFIVQQPDGTTVTVTGQANPDGAGYYRWTATTEPGEYIAQAQFSLVTGEIRSVMMTFTVVNPFNPTTPTLTDLIVDAVQLRLEDCFDSTVGGPWLREKTMGHFDYTKVAAFIPEALADINLQMPPTNLNLGDFAQWATTPGDNPNMPILVKATLCLTIKHLMRAYVEQYIPQGGQMVWADRTRYTQAWQAIYQVERQEFLEAVRLWKRTFLGLGHSALLTSSKAGRLYPFGSQRSRGISRGYY